MQMESILRDAEHYIYTQYGINVKLNGKNIDEPNLSKIALQCARACHVRPAMIVSRSHKREYVNGRHLFTYVAKHHGYSNTKIGEFLGRDQGTVQDSKAEAQSLYKNEPWFQEAAKEVISQLSAT
jgi:chromosomal replication initiation ATPase DnaA